MGMTIRGWGKLAVFLRLVTTEQEHIADAEELEVEQLILDVFLAGTTTDDVRDDRDVVLVLDSTSDGNRTRTTAHTLASEQAVLQLLIHILAMMSGDVDEARTKLFQGVDGAEESRRAIALQWRKNLERESLLVSFFI